MSSSTDINNTIASWKLPEGDDLIDRVEQMVRPALFAGYFGMFELKLSLILIPGILTGYIFSRYTAKILDRGFIRPAILSFSLLSGILLIVKTLF